MDIRTFSIDQRDVIKEYIYEKSAAKKQTIGFKKLEKTVRLIENINLEKSPLAEEENTLKVIIDRKGAIICIDGDGLSFFGEKLSDVVRDANLVSIYQIATNRVRIQLTFQNIFE